MRETNARPRWIASLLGVAILAAFAYAAFRFFWFDARPGDRVPLHGTAWAISRIEDASARGMLTLSFDAHADFGQVDAQCVRVEFEYSRDTDGDGIEFFDFRAAGSTCSGDQAAQVEHLRSALETVVVWRAPDNDHVEFQDSGGTVLAAVRAGEPQ